MASVKHEAAQPSLFRQIAVRLGALTLAFALLDVAIVATIYAYDQQALAEELIQRQAVRINRAFTAPQAAATPPPGSVAVKRPVGVSAWGFVILDESLKPLVRQGDAVATDSSTWPDKSTLDWTRRDAAGSGTRVTGVRRFEGASGRYWIVVSANIVGSAAYWPVIGRELVDHVGLPLVPLMVLLLIFNVQVVRRTLAPLEQAAREVDALDPSRMDARLTPPAASREVAALVSAVNRALDRLQHAMTLLKTFTADAAHELRTPLSVLRLRIDTLPDSQTKARLGEEIQAMTRLVNQMLDLAQADALGLDGASEVDLRSLGAEVVSQIAPLAFAKGHDIRLVDQNPASVLGHRDALGRALRNLIENAIRHTPGGPAIEVIVGPGAQLSVRDHGPGLPEGVAARIFDRFWRKSRSAEGGAGLGLGIVRSIIEAHGGTVTAKPAAGGGAVFVCTFSAAGRPAPRARSAASGNRPPVR